MIRRDRAMDGGVHAAVQQALLESGAIGDPDDEEVPDVGLLSGTDGRKSS